MLILNLDVQTGMNITTPDGTVIRIVNAGKIRAQLGIEAPKDALVLRDSAKKRERKPCLDANDPTANRQPC